jgi:hypothetical protein
MPEYVEVWRPSGRELVGLADEQQVNIGRDESNDIVLADDMTVSRLHAVLSKYGAGWCVRDLGSRNGTLVNGERVLGERVLRSGDEIRFGSSRLLYRGDRTARDRTTDTLAGEPAPEPTRRERDILLALCRPLFSGDAFPRPASVRQMATELFVTEAAVKQHLIHLYDKFAIHGDEGDRRIRLANEAVRRGAISAADLREGPKKR